jgi:hypothetical protein
MKTTYDIVHVHPQKKTHDRSLFDGGLIRKIQMQS